MYKNKQNTCPYCGNNPANHIALYIMEMLNIILNPVLRLTDPMSNKYLDTLASLLMKPYMWLFKTVGLWKYHDDIDKVLSDRTKVIWEEANKRGIEMQGIVALGKTLEQHRAKINGKWHHFESLPIPPKYDVKSYIWMDDKGKLRKFFLERKLPIAYGSHTSSLTQALEIFRQGKPPFSVKPRLGSRGRHTTTHIYTENQLIEAFNIAKQLCYYVVVEEHLIGSVYRGTYVNGEVVGILRGDPPRVTGDGKHTLTELIKIKNKTKHPKVKDFVVKPQTLIFLERQGIHLKSVLPKGKTIDLSEKIGISYGGFAADDTDITHPKIFKYIKKAGDALGAPVVGFDFIIADITKNPDEQRWGIIEANSLPFIDLHHFPLEGKPINVAAKVWDLWK